MTVLQSADIMMFRNLSQFLAQNAAILEKSPILKEDASDFQQALNLLEIKIQDLNALSEITGQEKLQLRETIIKESLRALSIIHRHALKMNLLMLQKLTDLKPSVLKQASDADFITHCNQIGAILTENSSILAAALVSYADQKSLVEKINLFKSVKPQVKLNITRKAVQNEDIEIYVKNIKTQLKKLLDASVLSVESSNPEFVREYTLNRQRRQPTKTTAKTSTVAIS